MLSCFQFRFFQFNLFSGSNSTQKFFRKRKPSIEAGKNQSILKDNICIFIYVYIILPSKSSGIRYGKSLFWIQISFPISTRYKFVTGDKFRWRLSAPNLIRTKIKPNPSFLIQPTLLARIYILRTQAHSRTYFLIFFILIPSFPALLCVSPASFPINLM